MLPRHAIADYNSLQLAEVVDNADPDERGRIRVRIHATEMECWAAVITASAGQGYGVSCLPRIGELVAIAFVSGDFPLVLGSIWSGQGSLPQQAAPHEQRYSVTTPAGSVMLFDDEDGPRMRLETPGGNSVTITDSGGGEIEIKTASESVKLSPASIEVQSAGEVKVTAATVTIEAASVTVNAAMSQFSGVVQCQTLIATSVVSSSYTPGAGNIW